MMQMVLKLFSEINGLIHKVRSQILWALRVLPGEKKNNEKVRNCKTVEDFYTLFVTDEMFEHISEQIKFYAAQSKNFRRRKNKWTPMNKNEIKRLFGLIIWMGMVKLPSLCFYWSQDKLFCQTFPQTVMSRQI